MEDIGGVREQQTVVLHQATRQQERIRTVTVSLLNWSRHLINS